MSIEHFTKLKEIDSLTKFKNTQLRNKQEEEKRLSKLLERKLESENQIASLKQEIISKNLEMADLEKKLKNASEQKQRLIDIGGDEKKIQDFTRQIADLEEKGFLYLEEQEKIEQDLTDAKTFLSGLEKTINEIKQEIEEATSGITTEVENAELRIKLLMDELPSDFKTLLLKVSAKNLAHGPFTRIEQGSCYFCRFKISRIEESEIDMQKGLKTCPQCGRIFLPYGA